MEFSDFFDFASIEAKVEKNPDLYPDLALEALYTSAEDLRNIFSHPLVFGTWVDLGAGVGTSVLQYGRAFPERRSIGLELSPARVQAGQQMISKLALENTELLEADLLSAEIPSGDCYFLYFPTGHVLDRVLSELAEKKRNFKIIAIESHGDLLARLDLENWLDRKAEVPLQSARHYPSAVIFEANALQRAPGLFPFSLSFTENNLLIRDGEKLWAGDSLGMEWLRGGEFNLACPPRTIHWDQVEKILKNDELDPWTRFAVALRKLGELEFETHDSRYRGIIRKILLKPGFSVELSSGETIEWRSIKVIKQGSLQCYDSSSPFLFPHSS